MPDAGAGRDAVDIALMHNGAHAGVVGERQLPCQKNGDDLQFLMDVQVESFSRLDEPFVEDTQFTKADIAGVVPLAIGEEPVCLHPLQVHEMALQRWNTGNHP